MPVHSTWGVVCRHCCGLPLTFGTVSVQLTCPNPALQSCLLRSAASSSIPLTGSKVPDHVCSLMVSMKTHVIKFGHEYFGKTNPPLMS